MPIRGIRMLRSWLVGPRPRAEWEIILRIRAVQWHSSDFWWFLDQSWTRTRRNGCPEKVFGPLDMALCLPVELFNLLEMDPDLTKAGMGGGRYIRKKDHSLAASRGSPFDSSGDVGY